MRSRDGPTAIGAGRHRGAGCGRSGERGSKAAALPYRMGGAVSDRDADPSTDASPGRHLGAREFYFRASSQYSFDH